MKKSSILKILLFAVLLGAMAVLSLTAPAVVTESVFAASDVLSVAQNGKAYYCADSYITGEGVFKNFAEGEFENELFSSLEFSLNGSVVPVSPYNVVFDNLKNAVIPNEYSAQATVTYLDLPYTLTVRFTISKKPLIVRAKINGESSAVIEEGESYRTSVEYEGFAGNDSVVTLTAPAIIQREPKMPTTGYTIVPEFAQSDYYEMIYVGAELVITANPDTQKFYNENGVDLLVLTGSFSPYYVLNYTQVGINAADVDYARINEKMDRYYTSQRIYERYKQSDAFIINLYLDGVYVDMTTSVNVRIKLDEKNTGKQEYLIAHFANDGHYELLTGTENNGYLTFNTVDLGEFIVLTPIEGVNSVVMVALCIGILGAVILIVLLVAIFRRKY